MIQFVRLNVFVAMSTVLTAIAMSIGSAALAADAVSEGQWYVDGLKLRAAQSITSGNGVIVAVVDTGVDNHPALTGSVLPGADFSDSNSLSGGDGRIDRDGHGTGMASLIAGHGRIMGVAPAAKILPVRVAGKAQRTNFAAGIQWAVDHGASVISISAAAPLADPREKQAIDNAIRNNVVVVASAGNLPDDLGVQFPARYPGVVAVGAISRNRTHSSVSVTGREIALVAPGEGVSSARPDRKYAIATGTSESAALVSGAVALVRSRFPAMPASEVIDRLTRTAIDVGPPGRDEAFGFGIVNPLEALTTSVLSATSEGSGQTSAGSDGGRASDKPADRPSIVLFGGMVLLTMLAIAGVATAVIAARRS